MTPKKIEQTGHMETAFGASRGVMALGGDIVTGAHPQGLDAPRIPGHPAGQPAGRPLEGWPASRPPWDRQASPRPEAGRGQRAGLVARSMAGTFML
jgi:hypothetical protein